MKTKEKERLIEAYKESLKEMYGRKEKSEEENVDEVISVSAIEGNWKSIVSHFSAIFDQLDLMARKGVMKDKKYGKRFRKLESDLQKLANDLDTEFGEYEDVIR